MLKVTIDLWPHGDAESASVLAEVEIVNVTGDPSRCSRDYAWRIREPSKGIDAKGWLVDWRSKDAVSLLGAVINEWSSGRELPFDNHGNPTAPKGMADVTPDKWWSEHDRRMEAGHTFMDS
jgi:hypothetical protein